VPLAAQIGALGITVMTVGMWATRPSPACVMPTEPRRHIDLTRTVDREHLAADVLEAERIARRYAAALAADPGERPSPAPLTLPEQCQTALVNQIATAHDLSVDQVRTATASDH